VIDLSPEDFERLVVAALDTLPESFASHLENVEITVEDEASAEQLRRLGHGALLGLYEGVPQTQRGNNYSWVLPDKITIFRVPIVRMSRTAEEVAEHVRHTVVHEIAHHFGISDDRLRELGVY
jgi:predicted Zn-dependent protease with MMP-like domain